MSIFPLPVFEADRDPSHRAAMTDQEAYERLKPPTSIVVRVGRMRFVAEYPYRGDAKPGCGSKLVARTHRGTEIVEMLTTTCGNSGCSKSVSRQEMLEYIENSGGRDYPFHTDGQILRVATVDDLNRWSDVQSQTAARVKDVKRIVAESGLPMKVVDVEPILGQEHLTVYFLSEDRVDFRELVRRLATEFHTRIEMRQVGARDEARLVADYERCGQHCCCKNFLKVLKPISMRSAKVQKATLDPLKISGRCGRLMCCLRYEDETYEDLKKRLPRNKTRVGTSEGPGLVVDGKILVQLVLVQLEHDGREIAVPVEELLDPNECPQPAAVPETPAPAARSKSSGGRRSSSSSKPESAESSLSSGQPADQPPAAGGDVAVTPDPLRGMSAEQVARTIGDRRGRGSGERADHQDRFRSREGQDAGASAGETRSDAAGAAAGPAAGEDGERRRRRRRRRGRAEGAPAGGEAPVNGPAARPGAGETAAADQRDGGTAADQDDEGDGPDGSDEASGAAGAPEGTGGRRRRRRRRRRGGGGGGGEGAGPSAGGSPPAA